MLSLKYVVKQKSKKSFKKILLESLTELQTSIRQHISFLVICALHIISAVCLVAGLLNTLVMSCSN